MAGDPIGRMALLWRGDRDTRAKTPTDNDRLRPVVEALAELGVAAEAAVYAEEFADEVRDQLLEVDGVLVWVDPLGGGRDRSPLDALLREVSAQGVWVSAHPDVILKMGVKEVLVRTRDLGWGTDTHLYQTLEDLRRQFPARLASGPRVLKQNRGNGGEGVWKVELVGNRSTVPEMDVAVRVLHARRGAAEEQMRLGELINRSERYFAGTGSVIDQLFQPRLPEGMIRCYLAQDQVVGFGHQLVKALMPPHSEGEPPQAALPGPRIMTDATDPAFQTLRTKMESEWVPGMQRLLDIDRASLPVLWDADFLYGPKTPTGQDTYVLCEINVSSVVPFPPAAARMLTQAAVQLMLAARVSRGARGRARLPGPGDP